MDVQQLGKGKWILISGGTRGIGRALVQHLAREGYEVAFTYQSSADAARQLEQEVAANGGRAHGHACDGRDFQSVSSLCEQLVNDLGGPYGLINNMGVTGDQLLFNLDVERYRDVVATNLDSAVYFSKSLVPAMAGERRGKILHMSSVSGVKGNKGQLGYSATKAAMIGITKTMALELARFKINVNAIAPGYIATDMIDQIPDHVRKSITDNIPLKRFGEVQEVAALASFLLSPQADYITGQTFLIDGGLTA
ncbi:MULTISPECIES: SDR family NAD(P)-dependent oxidoreductase [Pseudomonas]|uniref:2,3-dihydroxy-2,3-dihydro-p-cumate dehydrogenase n=1 Tax=Pseudomonas putida TaxID=303 RepID=A0AAW5HIM8_PSEPU|nr:MULTISPECIES: 3-oxoacyl-ACP reductase family protein [Pseudomonas]WHH51271.1 3-oxoacyl-ACP reductase family protein [Pseudomonas sp. Ap32]MBP2274137.1 3-oxoacyl-[acyl-carrier protein] reductase [Pseudomonas sp. BP6]MBP2286892.1 3-oxoacyl-[acyl-carrier protein] reductase [Pseudomonas sp. BP7]MCO1621711.1 3-oxoacyl-ACP reductase FabG [Pseudomonas putida]NVN62653.1 3-oxoacyl-ACP reductase FabG [Pseudomonas putida]